jgi:hypothetical protein
MEINNHPSARTGPAERHKAAIRTDFTRRNRDGIQRTLEDARASDEGDRVELSPGARSFSDELERVTQESSEHRQKVDELAAQYQQGSLVTEDRIQRAAEGLLRSR